MNRRELRDYVLSLPERVVRSLSALAGGAVREVGEVALPGRVRRSRLYRSLVDGTLRFLIEQLGRVDGPYAGEDKLPDDFLVRRAAGNVIEMAGIATFRASPVWVLAALADLSGAGRDLVAEISLALVEEGLLEPGARFETVDQILDGLERTAGQLADTVNTPPLDLPSLRAEWAKLRDQVARKDAAPLPDPALLRKEWQEIKDEAAGQRRTIFEISAAIAVSTLRGLPDNVRWLGRATRTAGRRTGEVLAAPILDHYRAALDDMRRTGFARFWLREFRPYLDGALANLSPARPTLTERFLARQRKSS
jgi:hypothetical protein